MSKWDDVRPEGSICLKNEALLPQLMSVLLASGYEIFTYREEKFIIVKYCYENRDYGECNIEIITAEERMNLYDKRQEDEWADEPSYDDCEKEDDLADINYDEFMAKEEIAKKKIALEMSKKTLEGMDKAIENLGQSPTLASEGIAFLMGANIANIDK